MLHTNRGFTVLELLIALLLSGIVISGAMSLYVVEHKQMLEQGDISDLQAAARSGAEIIATTVRMAGFNLPPFLSPIETFDTNPDTIVVTYNSGKLDSAVILHNMQDVSSPIHCTGLVINSLSAGDWIYLFDPLAGTGEFCAISAVSTSPPVLEHSAMPLSRAYPAGTRILKLNRSKFYVDRLDSTTSNLMVQELGCAPTILADNIWNLNLRYVLSWGAVVDQTMASRLIRMVEIRITARSPEADEGFNNLHRTRSVTFRVKVRNI